MGEAPVTPAVTAATQPTTPAQTPVIVEAKPEIKQEKLDDNNDAFVSENDVFTITINYYNDPDKGLIVETVDDEFDEKKEGIKSFTMTFKYPSQGDYETIMARTNYKSMENMSLTEMIILETTRAIVLMKKWSLKRKLTVGEITAADPKIIKEIINKVRIKIGTKGLI